MNFIIRNAVIEDNIKIRPLQDEIAELHFNGRPDLFRQGGRFYTDDAFVNMLEDPDQFIYVAETEDGSIIGYAFSKIIHYRNHSTYKDFDMFYIDDICVTEKFRRNGIARKFFDKCTAQAVLSECYNIDLGVYSFNSEAIAFYESCGMIERMRRMEFIIKEKGQEDSNVRNAIM